MKIGYACVTVGVPNTQLKTCRQQNATEENLKLLIKENLAVLKRMLEYNEQNGIKLFRISSDIIPFGSSPVNTLEWDQLFAAEFADLAAFIREHHMRVSMHPGQYTVLNSPNEEVVARAVDDLVYHTRFLNALETGPSHKLILHVGGVYQEREAAMDRFVANYRLLDPGIRERLVIENDDRSYNIAQVLEISARTGAPAVYDNLHNAILNADPDKDDAYWIEKVSRTWKEQDGPPKIHYSQQNPLNRSGSHSDSIDLDVFMAFYEKIKPLGVDIMLEVKDKNNSAVKCVNAVTPSPAIRLLEKEWGRYKYAVLEHDPKRYQEIRALLKDKTAYPVREFYRLIQAALRQEPTPGTVQNAAMHVWGYFREEAGDKEKAQFTKLAAQLEEDPKIIRRLKNFLWKKTLQTQQPYLLHSYYFIY